MVKGCFGLKLHGTRGKEQQERIKSLTMIPPVTVAGSILRPAEINMLRANGLAVLPAGRERIEADEEVDIHLLGDVAVLDKS